jgi:hypothetical protein
MTWAVTKLGQIRGYCPASPSARLPRHAARACLACNVVTLSLITRERTARHAELEGGHLVRPSLRAIDQEYANVQRGERIEVPLRGVGSPVETRALHIPFSLMTQAANSTP